MGCGGPQVQVDWTGNAVALAGRGALLAAALTSQEGLGASALDMEKGRLVVP